MRISDWSSDVCSSDLAAPTLPGPAARSRAPPARAGNQGADAGEDAEERAAHPAAAQGLPRCAFHLPASRPAPSAGQHRSEEHTSELQSLMRISYAVFCLHKTTLITSTTEPTSSLQTTRRPSFTK